MLLHLKWKKSFFFNSNDNNISKNFNDINLKNNNNKGFHIFSSIMSSIEIILSSLVFCTLIFYKKKLTRIDLLVIAKNIFYTFIYALFLFFSVQKQMYNVDEHYNYSTSKISCFYVSFLFSLHIALNIEQFKAIRNPCYVIKYMINNSYNISKHSIISFITSFIITMIPYFFQNETKNIYKYLFSLTEDNYFDISISKNKLLSPIIICLCLVLFYLYIKTKLFYINLKEKSLLHLKYANFSLLLTNLLYFFFAIFLLFLPLVVNTSYISSVIHIIFYIISILDTYLFIYKIFHSGFYYYFLSRTFIGLIFHSLCFGCCLRDDSFPNDSNSISTQTTKHTKSIYNFYSYLDYIVEDYVLDTFDFILYSITAGLSIVYKDFKNKEYHFKSKNDFLSIESQAQNLSGNLNNSNNNDNSYKNILNIKDINSSSSENNEEEDLSNSSTYNFFRICSKNFLNDNFENDLFSFSNCGDANIIITPLFVNESNESINLYQINKLDIIHSLLSNKFLSLLMTNSKKIFFKQLNNLIIKTYDNKLLIELHTDIKVDNADFFNFRVQINNLKEILIFVSKNPFIENISRDYYTYWQLMQFNINKKTFNKVLSSKDGDSFIISSNADSLFSLTRNNNLFQLEDFPFFQETLKNDMKFLKSIYSSNFCLLILYYEFEYNKNPSNNSIFSKIRIKLINESNSASDVFKTKKFNLSSFNFSSSNNTSDNNNITSPYKNINANLLDETDKEVFLNAENKKKIDDDVSDIPSAVNEPKSLLMKNGFESSHNNYKGILYFRWDNIFYQNKRIIKTRFYSEYIEEVLKYFSGK